MTLPEHHTAVSGHTEGTGYSPLEKIPLPEHWVLDMVAIQCLVGLEKM